MSEHVSVQDRGLHYGDGVFETLVVEKCEIQHWTEHMSRLASGCKQLNIEMPDAILLKSEVEHLVNAHNRDSKQVVKIIVTRGIGQRGYKPPQSSKVTRIISLHPYPEYPAHYSTEGVKIAICKIPLSCNPVLAGVKHLNRLEQVLAQSEWDDPEIIDGIMLNSDQQIVECTMSNIYWVTNNQLFTPDLSNCGVEGVTRGIILRLAEELQILTAIGNFMMKDLLAADEIFISNSVFGIFPVKSVGDFQLEPGTIAQLLMSKLN